MIIDYDSLERAHKQEGWSEDQQRHFEMGWEAGQRALLTAIHQGRDDRLCELVTYAKPINIKETT